jgi:hypothetical protein
MPILTQPIPRPAHSSRPSIMDQPDYLSDPLYNELDQMVDRNAPTQTFPAWVEDRVKPFTDEAGNTTYYTDGLSESRLEKMKMIGGFPDEYSAKEWLMNSYYDPDSIDLPRVIQELKDTRAIDTGGVPSYLVEGALPKDLMDSSQWDIPEDVNKIKYVTPEDARTLITDEQYNPYRDDEDYAGEIYEDDVYSNVLDYYASKGNPELRRGSSTGFWPTKNYPEVGINSLQDIVDRNGLIRKYSGNTGSAGEYSPRNDEIGVNEDILDFTYGSPGNKYRKSGFIDEVLGHEGVHEKMNLGNRGVDAASLRIPYPDNFSDPNRSTRKWKKGTAHPAMHYLDNQFFPESRSGVDINRAGFSNVNAIQNLTRDTPFAIQPNRVPGGGDKFGGQYERMQEAQWNNEMRPTSPSYTRRGGGSDPIPRSRTQGRHHFNEGGIAGLPGEWSPATIEGGEETFDLRSLGLDPGILSIEDLEDLFEQVGLDKSIIHKLINTGGLSQLVS